MKGVVLAGGLGSRLLPMTRVTNKHLLPVFDRPMIYFPIQQMVDAGIDDILIVTGGNHAGDFLRLLGNGSSKVVPYGTGPLPGESARPYSSARIEARTASGLVSYPTGPGYPPPAMPSIVYVVDRGADGFVCKSGTRLSPTVPQITIRIGPNENPHTRAFIAGRIYLEEHLESSQVEVTVNHPRSRP